MFTRTFMETFWHDTLRLPCIHVFFAISLLRAGQHVGCAYSFAKCPVGSEGIHHIANHWVFDAVSDEKHGEPTEQFAYEATCPTFREIGCAKVGTRQDERPTVLISLTDYPVKMDNAIPHTQLRDRELWRCVDGVPEAAYSNPRSKLVVTRRDIRSREVASASSAL